MACVCSRYKGWPMLGNYSAVMPTGRLWACKSKAKATDNKQLINLELLVFKEKPQTLALPYGRA